jgi:hypothetical protein
MDEDEDYEVYEEYKYFDAQVELVGSLADGYSYYWKRKVDDFAVDAVKGAQKFRE